MKYILSLVLAFFLLVGIFGDVSAAKVDFGSVGTDISKSSIQAPGDEGIVSTINSKGIKILTSIKTMFQGVLMIFIVYIGAQMVMSMGSDEDELSKAKNSIWYAMLGLFLINIPGTFFEAFKRDSYRNIDGAIDYSSWFKTPGNDDANIFGDLAAFGNTLNESIIGFLEVAVFGIAVFMIVLAGINMITSTGDDEKLKEAKNKILWSLIGLVSIGFIESWKYIVFGGKITDGVNLFQTFAELALFFAGPVAIVFLTLAGYYYITANGDEEKTKKAKSIVFNTVVATVILLASYTFLLDLARL